IAGVVNPPSSGKYQYWINEAGAANLDDFVAGAVETKGSWWPDWIKWIETLDDRRVPAKNDRIPEVDEELGAAPGRYVRTR
ncbi:MAG: class I poly(R)-hydroxyalkanoic acid synthase, partial [Sphingomonas sp.]